MQHNFQPHQRPLSPVEQKKLEDWILDPCFETFCSIIRSRISDSAVQLLNGTASNAEDVLQTDKFPVCARDPMRSIARNNTALVVMEEVAKEISVRSEKKESINITINIQNTNANPA